MAAEKVNICRWCGDQIPGSSVAVFIPGRETKDNQGRIMLYCTVQCLMEEYHGLGEEINAEESNK